MLTVNLNNKATREKDEKTSWSVAQLENFQDKLLTKTSNTLHLHIIVHLHIHTKFAFVTLSRTSKTIRALANA